MDATLRVEEHDDRVVATLDRPGKKNAIDAAMVAELHALCASLEAAPRVLVLTGAGGDFAAGTGIRQLRDRPTPRDSSPSWLSLSTCSNEPMRSPTAYCGRTRSPCG